MYNKPPLIFTALMLIFTNFNDFEIIYSTVITNLGYFVFLSKNDFLAIGIFVRDQFCAGIEFCVLVRNRTRQHID